MAFSRNPTTRTPLRLFNGLHRQTRVVNPTFEVLLLEGTETFE
jgi:hypothetical protein|tara:strand:- start:13510 stop:13638 length:129 start_codon:yes stop_codon:yes gene_type:complete